MAINDSSDDLNLFRQIAEAIGESLEAVYNMQDKERTQLVVALGLGKGEVHDGECVGRTGEASTADKTAVDMDVDINKLNYWVVRSNENLFAKADEETTAVEGSIEDLNNNKSEEVITAVDSPPAFGPLNQVDSAMEEVHPVLASLQRDAELVLRLLGPDRGPMVDAELVLAYLEAHRLKEDRVKVVVEELGGVDLTDSQTPERQLSLETLKSEKGKGKSSKIAGLTDLDQRLEDVQKRKLLTTFIEILDSPKKKPRLEVDEEQFIPTPAIAGKRSLKSPLSQPVNVDLAGPSQAKRMLPSEVMKDPVEVAAVFALVDSLSDMFPHTPLDYLKARCKDLVGKEAAFLRLTEELLVSQTPPPDWRLMYACVQTTERAGPTVSPVTPGPSGILASSSSSLIDESPIVEWENERHGELLSMFPTLSPQFLKEEVESVSRREGHLLSREVTKDLAMSLQLRVERLWGMSEHERSQLPARSQWELKKKEEAELLKWSGKMTPGDFLDMYEDPGKYFKTRREVTEEYKVHAIADLKGRFRYQSMSNITRTFSRCGSLLSPTVTKLSQEDDTRQTKRSDAEFRPPWGPACISFLKEKKFIELKAQIDIAKKKRETDKELKVAAARLAGTLVDCECCYSSDCVEDDMVKCGGGHLYCKDCVETSTKVAMGEGKIVIECLGQCDKEISWQELSRALQPNILSKLIQKRQAEEVEKAGMEDLVACPYCPYVTIMDNQADKVLVCRNPDCGRESCRLCREPNHVPLRCEEVEKGEQARKMIEEKLTEAMLRECVKCGNKFYKEEGCNKMTCRCGAQMCYLCKKAVKDYSHFYGQGGTPTDVKTCPLWSDNKMLHQMEVAKATELAREGLAKDNMVLSNDPTKDIVAVVNMVESEDLVRNRLFTRWLEVNTRLEEIKNVWHKERLGKMHETTREQIAGNEVVHLKNLINMSLESVWTQAALMRG